MGRINIDDVEKMQPSQQNNDFGFFSLRNNKDRAIVRFLHNNLRDVEVLAVHYVKGKDGKTKAVSCLRDVNDPIDKCPLCASGNNPLSIRYYFHLLEYKQDESTGEWVGVHRAFDRGRTFSQTLETIASMYNPLHSCVCIIERIGDAKSRDTTYNVLPLPPQEAAKYGYYEDDLDYTPVLGTLIPEKSAEEIQHFLQTGEFESNSDSNGVQARPAAPAAQPAYSQPAYSQPAAQPVAAASAEPRRRPGTPEEGNVGGSIGPRRRV